MWWILTAVLVLIFFEQLQNADLRTPARFKLKTYFWLVANLVILSALIPSLISFFNYIIAPLHITVLIHLNNSPAALQFILFLLFIDFTKYFSHFYMHKINFLWKIHSVHHSSDMLDALASFKHSWLEAFINIFLSCLLAGFFQVDLAVLALVNGLFIYVCLWQHANINYFNYKNSALSSIFITPGNHRLHHEQLSQPRHKNLGFIFTFWDKIFGTYSSAPTRDLRFGISETDYPYHSNLRQFFYPFFNSKPTKSKPRPQL